MEKVTVEKSEKLNRPPEIVIRPQTPVEEFDYLWSVLQDLPFFRKNNYKIELPSHPVFQALAKMSPDFSGVDRDQIRKIFESEVYDASFFDNGLKALESERERITQVLPTLAEFHDQWGFRLYPKYDIALTRYGVGGRYEPDKGRILMMTSADGTFKRVHPSHTPVHEMVHLGIQDNIVKHFGLTHWEKERIVDQICSRQFGQLLPGYAVQSQGDIRVDPYVTTETLKDLPTAISHYVTVFPR